MEEIISQEDAQYYKNRFEQERRERERHYLVVKKTRNGDFGFEISGIVGGLTFEEMNQFRAMIPVAIGVSEDIFRRTQEKLNMACCAESSTEYEES